MILLHHLSRLNGAPISDSGNMDLEPGYYRLFSSDQATTVKFLPGESLHEFDHLRAIELPQQLEECPEKLLIFAVQPRSITWGQGLSEDVSSRVEEYEHAILTALDELSD